MRLNRYTLLAFLIFGSIITSTTYLGDYTHLRQYTALVVLIFLLIDCVRQFKYYLQFKKVNLILAAFCICVFISGIVNANITNRDTFLISMVYIINISVAFLSFEYFAIRGKVREVLRIYYYLLLAAVILNDLLSLIAPSLVQRYDNMYLLGNKFGAGSLRLLASAFAFSCKKPKQGWLLIVWSVVMALVTDVITMFIGTLVIALMLLLPPQLRRFTQRIWIAMAVLAFCSLVLVLYEGIMKVTVVNQVVNYFEKERTFGSRLYIYSVIMPIIAKRPIFGYGYNNSYPILIMRGIQNTQNGVMENFFQFGYLGGAIFLLLVFSTMRRSFQGNKKECYPLYALIITYFVMSSVEICLSVNFLLVLAGMMVLSTMDDENKEEYMEAEEKEPEDDETEEPEESDAKGEFLFPCPVSEDE